MPQFSVHSSRQKGEHRFDAYDCRPVGDDLVAEIAGLVRDLYIDQAQLRARLVQAADAIGDIVEVDELNRAVDAVTEAAVPAPGVRETQPHLDTARNELGEVLAYAVLEEVHGAVMPAKRIREKETPQLPTRGLDALAFEDGTELRLLVCEVKTSDENASPPRVVGDGDTSLHAQTINLLRAPDRLLSELNWVYKHCGPEHELLVARAILLQTRNGLPVTAVPVLVRPVRCHQGGDCGIFEEAPDSVAPARVRFSVVRINGEIADIANAVYNLARGGTDAR